MRLVSHPPRRQVGATAEPRLVHKGHLVSCAALDRVESRPVGNWTSAWALRGVLVGCSNRAALLCQVLDEQPRGDAGPLVDHGQTAAGMRATPDQIHAPSEPIMRAEVEHLAQRVCEVEGCAFKDTILTLPVPWC